MKFLAFCVHYRMFYIVCKYVFGDFSGFWGEFGAKLGRRVMGDCGRAAAVAADTLSLRVARSGTKLAASHRGLLASHHRLCSAAS